MNEHMKNQLFRMLKKLEKAQQFIQKTQCYGKDERRIRILAELIKEQIANEDTHTSVSSIR